MRSYYQGRYKLRNIEKYKGNPDNVVYRSSWEHKAFVFCDMNPKIIHWSSEETIVPYVSPVDGRVHRYFVDLTIWFVRADGSMGRSLVEIKPYAQTIPPVKKGRKSEERFREEVKTYLVNQAKWDASKVLCQKEGWSFILWTENELLPGGKMEATEMEKQKQFESKMKRAFTKKKSVRAESIATHLKRKMNNEAGKP